MWISNPGDELWAGDENSLERACELAAKINATQPQAFLLSEEDAKTPSLLSKHGNVGVVSISGTLFTSAPAWAKVLFGVTDYPMIQEALVEAAKDESIGSILLDIDSPGGAVNGVGEVADLVKEIDAKVKPVHAYSAGRMNSAAYWIPSGAREISAANLAEVGSIGVLQRHVEVTKMEEKMGVTTTVLRAGKYKALGNPFEPLSKLAKDDIQSKLDYVYGIFLEHVASNRGVSAEEADEKMAQGRVFIGDHALAAGLIDDVQTFAEALTAAQKVASKHIDSRKSLIQNPKKQQEGLGMKRKATLTEQDVALLANGVKPGEQVAEDAPPKEAAAEPVAENTETEVQAEAGEPAVKEEEVQAQVTEDPRIALLQAQIKEKDDALVAARVELEKTKDALAAADAALEPCVEIVKNSVTKMYVALGQPGSHVAALNTEALLEEHKRVAEVFSNTFKVGGVAATAPEKDAGRKPVVDPVEKARLNAARSPKK